MLKPPAGASCGTLLTAVGFAVPEASLFAALVPDAEPLALALAVAVVAAAVGAALLAAAAAGARSMRSATH
jgi:hypothetical protein